MDEQQKIFEELWDKFSHEIARGNGSIDFPSESERKPQYVTTIVRLPNEITQKCLDHLNQEFPDDYHYAATDIHLTLLNLNTLLDGHALDNRQKQLLADEIEKSISSLPPLRLKVSGLGIFPTTVYTQVYDLDNLLETYRDAIKNAVTRYMGTQNDGHALVKGIAFANLVRFQQIPAPETVELIRPLRDIEFGEFIPSALELVTTDKLLSQQNTTTHRFVQLPTLEIFG